MAISMKSRVIRSSDPIAEPVDDELVMADIDSGKYYGLNDIATAIWQNLEKKITVEDLCKRLCESYEVNPEQCST
ncbi:MAG: PqqD family protein, partial [Deltaproteobacteria bacterium HGW-Deltaproteobacteria-9]